MKVVVLLRNGRVGAFSWGQYRGGRVSLSGTDSAIIELMAELHNRGVTVELLAERTVDGLPFAQRVVGSRAEGIRWASAHGGDIILLGNTHDDEMTHAVAALAQCGPHAIVWDQNGPSRVHARLLAETPAVRRVVVVSGSQADWVRDEPVFEKMEVIPNFLPRAFSEHLAPQEPVRGAVCYVGALTPTKGFQYLARAWPEVRRSIPWATLQVFGSAQLYDRRVLLGPLGVAEAKFEEESIVRHLGGSVSELAAAGVCLRGLADKYTLARTLPTMAVGVVNPSLRGSVETFCVSALELQAAGVPVVGGRAGGLRETVQTGKTGYLVGSHGQLASVIVHLLSDEVRARELGAAGRRWAAEFSVEKVVDMWVLLLQRVLRGERAKVPTFSWSRLTSRTLAREVIRQVRGWPGGARLPSLGAIGDSIRGRDPDRR